MKIQFPDKLTIAHLNINSIRNKFDFLSFIVENNADIYSFQKLNLMIHFHQVNLKYVDLVCLIGGLGGLLLYIRDDIPTKLLKHYFGTNIENLSVQVNLRKRKWFFNGSYNPRKSKILNHLNYLNLVFNKYSKVYDNFIFMGDFNVTVSDKVWKIFVL